MTHCAKAMARRLRQPDFIGRFLVGNGLDIGGAADPLAQYREMMPLVKSIRDWNGVEGDAQHLTGLADAAFDFVHACHVLQRQPDPGEALRHWFRVLKPGGHLIVLVPDEDMYEQGVWPSRVNPLNRWTFTLAKARSWSPASLNLLDMIPALGAQADLRRLEVLDSGFRHNLPRFDQTLTPLAECAIEMVVRKRPPAETAGGGRLNPEAPLSPADMALLTGRNT